MKYNYTITVISDSGEQRYFFNADGRECHKDLEGRQVMKFFKNVSDKREFIAEIVFSMQHSYLISYKEIDNCGND